MMLDDDGLPEPEIFYNRAYYSDCDTTFLLREVSYPGGREHEALNCPSCGKQLNVQVETETTYLLGQAKGDVGEEIYNIVTERENGRRVS
jgi:hypothetical protein